uniref:Uncharacterized protein n=1 Tax=Rhizophora mucronata TaxID=61149 RepID=A0A2P2QES3_RHIMU
MFPLLYVDWLTGMLSISS